MKHVLKKSVLLAMGTLSLIALTGCGRNDAPRVSAPVGAIPGASSGLNGGCIPINAQIPFTANNIYFDWANIIGGNVPEAGRAIGQIVIGGAASGGPYQRSGSDGVISMNITPMQSPTAIGSPYAGYPNGTTQMPTGYNMNPQNQVASYARATGYIQISQLVQNDIRMRFGQNMGSPYMMPNPTQPNMNSSVCVSGIALNLGHHYNTIHSGVVYLYLNNSQYGYRLVF